MQTIWYLRGELAGTFAAVDDATADKLAADGTAQIYDGVTPLAYPETHPDVQSGAIAMPEKKAKPKTRAKRKYPNKQLKTDPDAPAVEPEQPVAAESDTPEAE